MPPKGKMQLTEKEIALLHWWILNGADALMPVREVSGNDTIKNFLSSKFVSIDEGERLQPIDPVDTAQLSNIRSLGFSVQPVALGSGWLQVSTLNMSSLKDKDMIQLLPVASNILWLSVTDQEITDDGMNILDSCKNLRRLDLHDTRITDGVANRLNSLRQLSYLNIVGTSFSDRGLMALSEAKSLRQLYCWRTSVTEKGVSMFQKRHPSVKIEMGGER